MPGLTRHSGTLAVYAEDNIDTDRIIPARFLSLLSRQGYGELLFKDVRGPEFPLDRPEAVGATILVVGTNFGCGSSREHAVWAIQQAGFQAVVALKTEQSSGFSDILRGNASNCGLCLVELNPRAHGHLVRLGSGAHATVDVLNCVVESGGESFHFEMNDLVRQQLIDGLDLIGTTLQYEDSIRRFEARWDSFVPERSSIGAR